ncbi:MAG: 2'-5' RNA ligase family protein [Nanoarchaeota archaeon]|nr:2'-5' RNA ligase family protein [Nanoarchaeota archaeon]
METLFIEFRLHGYARKYAKRLIFDIARKFHVKGVTRKRPVPHITLIAPFRTNNRKEVIRRIGGVCKKYTLVPFKLQGFNYFDKVNKVIYLDIAPSVTLKKFRNELSKAINDISGISVYTKMDFKFHVTLAFKDIDDKFEKIWEYICSVQEPDIKQHLLRVTLQGKGGGIISEYDLLLKKFLNKKQSLSGVWWRRTIIVLKNKSGSTEECKRDSLPKPVKKGISIFGIKIRF